MLTGSAYADDRHISSRMAIWAYAGTPADPRWRTSMVSWPGQPCTGVRVWLAM